MVNLKNFIRLLALIVTVAVLVEGVVVNFLLEDTKINGPIYQRITADKDRQPALGCGINRIGDGRFEIINAALLRFVI